eukprot:3692630-Rhodomonas_salina.1
MAPAHLDGLCPGIEAATWVCNGNAISREERLQDPELDCDAPFNDTPRTHAQHRGAAAWLLPGADSDFGRKSGGGDNRVLQRVAAT